MAWWPVLLGVLVGFLLLYAVLLGLLLGHARQHPGAATFRAALRLLPDVIGLVRRLAADASLPRGVRIRLVALLVYLASPVDLIPDVVPVIGYADDVVVVALVLRAVVRRAGPDALSRHWTGTAAGLLLVRRLVGLGPGEPEISDAAPA